MTSNTRYAPPSFASDGFNCPFCQAFANQIWGPATWVIGGTRHGGPDYLVVCQCARCKEFSVWVKKNMVFPSVSTAPSPNPDLLEDIKVEEGREE